MPDAFVSMRDWLERDLEPVAVALEVETQDNPQPLEESSFEIDEAIDASRRFRATLAEAVDSCVEDVLRDLAADILGRELLLAPCDIQAIVARAIERYGVTPVRIRVHREEMHLVESCGLAIVADDSLRSGDVVIETQHGSIDASLGVRLERLLSRLKL